jgi:transcriptional regulator with XRE-family HTH domain
MGRVLKVEDWAEIRRLRRAEGMPIKAVARRLGVGLNTVRRALAADEPPKYQRLAKGSIFDEVEPQVRELLADLPTMALHVDLAAPAADQARTGNSTAWTLTRPFHIRRSSGSGTASATSPTTGCDCCCTAASTGRLHPPPR